MPRSSNRARRFRFALCWLVLVLSLGVLPRRASAAEAPAELVSRGLELRRERRDGEALALFQRAFAASPKPMILSQIALAEQALGRWLSAEQDLTSALAAPDRWVEANRVALERALTVIRSHLSWLTVTSNSASAQLWLDNRNLGAVRAAPFRVEAGVHELSLRMPDGRSSARSVELIGGEREHFHIDFSEAPPLATAKIPSQPARAVDAPSKPQTMSTREALAVASAAVSVVALAAAVTVSLLRADYVEHYNSDACAPNRSQQCAAYREVADTLGTLSVVGYVVGGVAALGSAALFTAPYWYPSSGSSGTQAGLLLSGQF
jgi:hypothetical protein